MELDLFTLVAQLINFVVLLLLLRRFLYGPILRAVNTRQKKIAGRLLEAEEARESALREAEAYRRRTREIEAQREDLLDEARAAAKERRDELMAQLREEVDDARARWRRAIQREREDYLEELEDRVGHRIHAIARRALSDLADETLESRVVASFLRRLRDETTEVERVARALPEAGVVEVRSSFPLEGEQRQRVLAEMARCFGEEASVDLAVDAEVICGIEVRTPGWRIGWSLREYLESLEELYFSGAEGAPAQRLPAGGS